MNKVFTIAGLLLLSTAFAGCEDIYEGGEVQKIDMPVQIRATVVPFDRDEPETMPSSQTYGVFMTPSESGTGIAGAPCMEMIADNNGNLSRKGIDTPLLYPQDIRKVDFVCFAPFDASIATGGIIPVDVSDPAKAAASDYLYATSRNKYPALAAVKMQMKHILASVDFNVTPGEGFTRADMQTMTLAIEDVTSRASFALADGTFTPDENTGDITLATAADGSNVSGFVVPQQCSLVLKCTVGDLVFHKKLGPMTFDGARRYKYDLLVSVPGIEVNLREIEDWKVEVYD